MPGSVHVVTRSVRSGSATSFGAGAVDAAIASSTAVASAATGSWARRCPFASTSTRTWIVPDEVDPDALKAILLLGSTAPAVVTVMHAWCTGALRKMGKPRICGVFL